MCCYLQLIHLGSICPEKVALCSLFSSLGMFLETRLLEARLGTVLSHKLTTDPDCNRKRTLSLPQQLSVLNSIWALLFKSGPPWLGVSGALGFAKPKLKLGTQISFDFSALNSISSWWSWTGDGVPFAEPLNPLPQKSHCSKPSIMPIPSCLPCCLTGKEWTKVKALILGSLLWGLSKGFTQRSRRHSSGRRRSPP